MPKLTDEEIKLLAVAVVIKSDSSDQYGIPAIAEQVYDEYEQALQAIETINNKRNPPPPGMFKLSRCK